jgi:hypothetical protein
MELAFLRKRSKKFLIQINGRSFSFVLKRDLETASHRTEVIAIGIFMSHNLSKKILFVLTLSLLSADTFASGWVQPEGSRYIKIWNRTIAGNQGSAPEATGDDFIETENYVATEIKIYAEQGLTNRLTVFSSLTPLGYASSHLGATQYIGPLGVGGRFGVLQGDWNLAVQAAGSWESGLGKKNILNQSYTDKQNQQRIAVFNPVVENTSGQMTLNLGKGFNWGWLNLGGGFQLNSSSDMDSVMLGSMQLGWNINKTYQFTFASFLHLPTGDVENPNISGAGQTEYVGVSLGLRIAVSETMGFHLGLEGAPHMKSNSATPSFIVGLDFL